MGIVSAKGRATGIGTGSFEDFIQTDAPINRGNSGGALVNTRGELIGINSQILSPSGGNIGIGFAIPSNMARNVMDQLVKGGTVRRGMLGVTVQNVNSDLAKSLGLEKVAGALVSSVRPDGPAARAGVQRGDVVTELDGVAVTRQQQPAQPHRAHAAGQHGAAHGAARRADHTTSPRRLARARRRGQRRRRAGGSERARRARSASPSSRSRPSWPTVSASAAAGGVAVTAVDPEGAAAAAGIRQGDVIEEVNRKPVRTAEDLRAALRASGSRPALVLVNRRGDSLYLTLTARG